MNISLVSSPGNCGIYECAQIMKLGFEELGHRVRYLGVKRRNWADLQAKLQTIEPDEQIVIFEYEPGIFDLKHLVWAMARLRIGQRKKVLLSIHELEASKFPEYHYVLWRLNEPSWQRSWKEPFYLIRGMGDVAYRYATLRLYLNWLGILSHRILVHSPRVRDNARLVTANQSKLRYAPLAVKSMPGDRNVLRRQLGLPLDRFAFLCAGFLFRRKRITDVITHLPESAELWIVGTTSEYDPGYLEEIETHVAETGKQNQVRIILEYDVEPYLMAADAAVLYYRDIYQSAVLSQAVGAGKPCIVSNLPGFADFHSAALVVSGPLELRQAMRDIQEPEKYRQLAQATVALREAYSPRRIAQEYLAGFQPADAPG